MPSSKLHARKRSPRKPSVVRPCPPPPPPPEPPAEIWCDISPDDFTYFPFQQVPFSAIGCLVGGGPLTLGNLWGATIGTIVGPSTQSTNCTGDAYCSWRAPQSGNGQVYCIFSFPNGQKCTAICNVRGIF